MGRPWLQECCPAAPAGPHQPCTCTGGSQETGSDPTSQERLSLCAEACAGRGLIEIGLNASPTWLGLVWLLSCPVGKGFRRAAWNASMRDRPSAAQLHGKVGTELEQFSAAVGRLGRLAGSPGQGA